MAIRWVRDVTRGMRQRLVANAPPLRVDLLFIATCLRAALVLLVLSALFEVAKQILVQSL